MSFNSQDKQLMALAIDEARKGMALGNYPCGAVLTADDEIIGRAHNLKENRKDRISHAEELLYIQYSAVLKQRKADGNHITMYTTLEPCLMCFATAVMHRVDRIVAATPDPYGNMSRLNGSDLGEFYASGLPKLEYGLLFDGSVDLIKRYLEKKGGDESKRLIHLFEKAKLEPSNS